MSISVTEGVRINMKRVIGEAAQIKPADCSRIALIGQHRMKSNTQNNICSSLMLHKLDTSPLKGKKCNPVMIYSPSCHTMEQKR